MSTHPFPTPRPERATFGRRLRLGAAILALAAAPLGCVVEANPRVVYVETQPAPATVVVEEGADTTVVVDDFYEPLGYYGVWVYVPGYGRVWQPASDVAGAGFTPYGSDGHWVVNADGDWVFVSRWDSQWGWATYHYGRWVWTDYYGWCWVPGTAWAPAWVEWRYGGGYVGWVPMGPPGYVVVEEHWVFVERGYIGAEGVVSHRLPAERVHEAYVAANPILETKGSSKWMSGPNHHDFADAGIEISKAEVAKPPAGYIRAQGQVTVAGAGARKASGRVVTEPYVRPGTTVAPGAGVASPGPQPPPGNRSGQGSVGAIPQPGSGSSQPGMGPSQPGVGPVPQPGMGPSQPGMGPSQPGVGPMPQPQPTPAVQPRPQPMPQPSPGIDPRPSPQPMPSPRPSVSPSPSPRPSAAPAPRPQPRPSTPAPRPSGGKKRR